MGSSPLEVSPVLDYVLNRIVKDGVMSGFAESHQEFIPAGAEQLDPLRFAPANRRRLSGPALRTFLAIADLWKLNEGQRRLILGYPSR